MPGKEEIQDPTMGLAQALARPSGYKGPQVIKALG
jgi:hypothetical protein